MGRHEDFQISVDGDNRVSINFQANPGWHRSQCCWEAKGPVAEKFNILEPRIRAELNKSRRESGPEAAISLFMVGKTPEYAKPIIVISCTDKETRKDAKKAIKDSGVVQDTYFEIGYMRYSPPGPLQPVTMDDKTSCTLVSPAQSYEVYFDPAERIRLVGMPILVKQAEGLSRRATANAVYDGRQFGYITAAHAFEQPTPDVQDTDDEDDMDMPFDSDDESLLTDDLDLLSIHSATSPGTSDSGQSFLSLTEATLSRGSTTQMAADPLRPSAPTSEQISSGSGPLDLAALDASQSDPAGEYRALGRLATTFAAMDSAIILVADDQVIHILEGFKNSPKASVFTTDSTRANTKSVIAWTTHGSVKGILLQTPVSMRLANSITYELVYKFTYAEYGDIQTGDCGTLVTDSEGKVLYGHIVAKSEHERIKVAYMIAAQSLVEELSRVGKWSLLSVEDHAQAGKYITSAQKQSVSAQTDDVQQTPVHRHIDSGVVSSPRSPRTKLTLDTSLAQKTNSGQHDAREDSPSESAPSSSTRPRRTRTHVQSPIGLSVGSISLLFQAFAWCIQGYEIISDAARSHKDFVTLIKLKSEEHRMIGWARQAKLDYTEEVLAINNITKIMILDIIDQQRILLYGFLETEKKKKLDKFTKFSQASRSLVQTGSSTSSMRRLTDPSDEARAAEIPPTDTDALVQKTLSFLKRFQDGPNRFRWGAYYSDRCGELVEKLTALNEQLLRIALMQGSTTAVSSEVAKDLNPVEPVEPIVVRGTELDIQELQTLDGRRLTDLYEYDDDARVDAYYKATPVWIEWKLDDPAPPGRDTTNLIEERVAKLSATLEMNSNDPYQFCVPHGLGYFKDEEMGRFGLVFEKPRRAMTKSPVTLYTLLSAHDSDGEPIVPSFTARVALMRTLAETLERLHDVNWLHKDFRSANILFFNEKDESRDLKLETLIVSGFHYSRPSGRDDMTERPSDDLGADLYRHPYVQSTINRGFKRSHDIYSLGLALLEIASWKPLDQILNINLERARPRDIYRVKDRLLSEPRWLRSVKSNNGDTLERIIRICLEGPRAFDIGEDWDKSNDDTEALLQRAFGEEVVAKLAEIRGL